MNHKSNHLAEFLEKLETQSQTASIRIPPRELAVAFVDDLLALLFPIYTNRPHENQLGSVQSQYDSLVEQCHRLIEPLPVDSATMSRSFFDALPDLHERLLEDAEAMLHFDPAAESLAEVIGVYPGFYAVAVYRFAHRLADLNVPLLPRMWTEHAHSKTGIDIHPTAEIGRALVIDHGTGTVIGATAHIGDRVTLYHGVTLGALQVNKSLSDTKRHPTLEDDVLVYANATILGGDTIIGHHSVIGGNTWITRSVSAWSRIYYRNPSHLCRNDHRQQSRSATTRPFTIHN